ncbi:MAG: glycosyltransferase family 4 protein [Candidatus Omnitrophica bacterium]|nr:glycosyltransferase family 4 protein [Candidatus Omnitrophota bacterium]
MQKKSKKHLRIAQMHWGFPPIIGGVETHLCILLPTFVEMGHTVSLLTGSVQGEPQEVNYKGVHVQRTPIMDLNWLFKRGLIGIEQEVTDVFTTFINKHKPDIIHVHNMHYFSKAHAQILERLTLKKGIPLFLTAHNVWDDMLFFELTTEIKWTHIIAVSHFIEKELIGIGCNQRNITTVHHGVDEKIFHPAINPNKIFKKYPQLQGKQIFFHPARMGWAKGCDVSIKALRLVKARVPNAMLILAGTKNIIDWGLSQQKDIAYMVHLIEKLKVRDNVLLDFYSLEDMPQMYAASDVCIYPSNAFEPFGLTMLEAMACAKPMIVTKMGGMPEIIQDGINGYVVPPKDYEQLASRIVQLFGDAELRARLGRVGRNMVETSYTRQVVTKGTLDLYKKYT